MPLELLHYKDRITVINPRGSAAVLTLWSPIKTILGFLERERVDLDPASSMIAAIGNLYGDGLPQLLRNLVYNPTIASIIIVGQELSESGKQFENFIRLGTEKTFISGTEYQKIKGTERILDMGVTRDMLDDLLVFNLGGKFSISTGSIIRDNLLQERYSRYFDRVDIPLPKVEVASFPSDLNSHTVVRNKPIDAWKELVFRIMRFGRPSQCGGGKSRIELCNVKVIINTPIMPTVEELREVGLTAESVIKYQQDFLDPSEPVNVHYTYGNRMRGTFDTISYIIDMLRFDLTRRDCYITLWNNFGDMLANDNENSSHPCLVSLFFRVLDDKLHLTSTWRVHNSMSAWLVNLSGLMSIQATVLNGLKQFNLSIGSITVISHSITIDPAATDKMPLAQGYLKDGWRNSNGEPKSTFKPDPQGYFSFTIDNGELVVIHMSNQQLKLKEYRGKTAEDIERQLVHDCAIYEPSHALYVGRELYKLELKATTN